MQGRAPTVIDLDAEVAKLSTVHRASPREGRNMARLGSYRDGLLLLGMSTRTGRGHWEIHPEDELIHILDGTRVLEIVCDAGPPRSFELRAGTIAVVPQGAWHRFHASGFALVLSAVIPGPHVDLDVADPRPHAPSSSGRMRFANRSPSIVDLHRELATLAMFRRTPEATSADRKGSVAELATYRDGLLLALKSSGKDHWESHADDELVHILEGAATLEMVDDQGPPRSFEFRAGTIAVIPKGAWHRFLTPDGATQVAVTPFPGEHIELDVDDPRTVWHKPA